MLLSKLSTSPILSGIASLTVLAATLLVLSIQRVGETPVSLGIHAYLVDWCQSGRNANYLSQRDAHVSMLCLCALFIILGTKFAPKLGCISMPRSLKILSSTLVVGFCLANIRWWTNQQVSITEWMVAALAICIFSSSNKLLQRHRALSIILQTTLAAIGLFVVLPGLVTSYDSSWMPPTLFVEFQQGYSVVAAQCDRISMGQEIFVAVKPYYGILLQILSGLWESYFGIFTFGQNIQIIRWLQALSVLCLYLAYAWYARKNPVAMTLSFLMVLPWLHTNQISLIFPNLSPWRTFGFPLALVGLILCGRFPEKIRFYCLGLLAGVCISLNLESGICILVGFISYGYFSKHSPGKSLPLEFLKCTFECLLGMSIFLIALYLFVFTAFGYPPNLEAYIHHLQTIQKTTKTGYLGGLPLQYSPLPVLFLCHYTYVLFRAALSTTQLTERECFRAFAATMALVWSAYYFNRPAEWYFHLQFYFYGVLLIDIARLSQSSAWKSDWFEKRTIAMLCLVCLIAPQLVLTFHSACPSYVSMLKQWKSGKTCEKDAQLISGIFVEPKAATEIKDKASFLQQEYETKKVFYFTGSTVLIPKLTKLYLNASFDDPFMELPYVEATDSLIDQLKSSAVQEILIDSDASHLIGDKFRSACWKNIQEKLPPEFVFSGESHNWKIFTRATRQNRITSEIGVMKAKH